MPDPAGNRSKVTIVAVAGSVLVAILLLAAGMGIGMEGMRRIGRLRLAPSTIALVLIPVPSVAWVAVLWSRSLAGPGARFLRVIATLLLVLLALACAAFTLFVILVRPVDRISGS